MREKIFSSPGVAPGRLRLLVAELAVELFGLLHETLLLNRTLQQGAQDTELDRFLRNRRPSIVNNRYCLLDAAESVSTMVGLY